MNIEPQFSLVGMTHSEPEIRYSREGLATTRFQVAVRPASDGVPEPSVLEVICHGELAENVVLSLTKSMQVVAHGRLTQRESDLDGGTGVPIAVELLADAVGPDLSYATAEVIPVGRRTSFPS